MAGKLICTIHSNNFKLTRRGPVSLVTFRLSSTIKLPRTLMKMEALEHFENAPLLKMVRKKA